MRTLSFGAAVVCLLPVVPAAGADAAAHAEPPPQLLVRIADPAASDLVRRSILGAAARLERPACRSVLGDFRTPSGASLAGVLDARSETPARHLTRLLYLDGGGHPLCRSGAIRAYTAPGWHVVYVCAAEFKRSLARRPAEAEAVLIHETLHTLGLDENPPTPREIQDRVRARCVASR